MRWILLGVGALLTLVGAIWLLQGLGILAGSFMSGQPFWATVGLLALIAGLVFIVVGARRKASGAGP